jgi:hypothetical protein
MEKILEGYTRVSTFLSMIKDLSHIDPVVLRNKADLGTAVHEAIHTYITKGRKRKIFTDPKEEGYLDSYILWHKLINPKYSHLETRLYDHQLKITGAFDGLGYIGGELALIDFKCTSQALHETWPLQGTFYDHLIQVNNLVLDHIPRYLFIQLSPFGRMPKVHEYFPSTDKLDYCLSLVKLYRKREKEMEQKDNESVI